MTVKRQNSTISNSDISYVFIMNSFLGTGYLQGGESELTITLNDLKNGTQDPEDIRFS